MKNPLQRAPREVFFLHSADAPRWGYGSLAKHTYTQRGHAENAARRARKAGATVTVFVATCDWKVDEQI